MNSLTMALSSLIALIVLSGLCRGETFEDSSDLQLQNLILPAIESNQVLNREIRSPFSEKKINIKKNNEKKRRMKGRKIKRKLTKNKNVEKRRKMKEIKNNNNRKKQSKKDRKRKSRKNKGNKKVSNRKNVSKSGKKRKSGKMNESKTNSKRKHKLKKGKKGNQRKPHMKKTIKSAGQQSRKVENCDIDCQCGHICTRSKTYERQIIRLNKRSKTIQTRRSKIENFKLLAKIITSKCEANSNTSQYNTSLLNCAASISAICQAPEIPEDLKYNGTGGKCFDEIIKFKTPSCKSTAEDPCPLELNDWAAFVKSHNSCKPVELDKLMSETLKNCSKYAVKPCKSVEEGALQYIGNCVPGENQVEKTTIEENGEIIVQTDTYNPNTREVSISVPAHGDFQEAKIIMDVDSGTLMTSTQDTCQIKSIPDDVNPNDIKTNANKESRSNELITDDMETKDYTLVIDAGAATADDISKLSPTMTKECANKTIVKTEEKRIDKEKIDTLKNGGVITVELGKQGRQNGCDNPVHACAAKGNGSCWRWTHGRGQINVLALHKISGDGFCVDCCDTDNCCDSSLCKCDDLTSFEKVQECLLKALDPSDPCPGEFITFCDQCYADFLNIPIPTCTTQTDPCPPGRFKCGGKCYKNDNMRECNGKCIPKNKPCNGACQNNDIICGNQCSSPEAIDIKRCTELKIKYQQSLSKQYRRYRNSRTQINRFIKNCETLANKSMEADNGEFNLSATADGTIGSDVPFVVKLGQELKNCSETAQAICDTKNNVDAQDACTDTAKWEDCKSKLTAWLDRYSYDNSKSNPTVTDSCLNGLASDFDTCSSSLVALTPPDHCFGQHISLMENAVMDQHKNCSSTEIEGSFANCREKQIIASEKCKGGNGMFGSMSTNRMKMKASILKRFKKLNLQ